MTGNGVGGEGGEQISPDKWEFHAALARAKTNIAETFFFCPLKVAGEMSMITQEFGTSAFARLSKCCTFC